MTSSVHMQRAVLKRAVKVVKRIAGFRRGEHFGKDYELSKNVFLNYVNLVRKGEQGSNEILKDKNGQILWECEDVRKRWAGYFGQVMKVADVREANIKL